MNKDLHSSITAAFAYLSNNSIEIPNDLAIKARLKGIQVKAYLEAGNLSSVNYPYHDKITSILTGYFEGGSVTGPRNEFKQATSNAFLDAFEMGWQDGGAALPLSEDALAWLDTRLNQEFGYIDMLFQQAKELRNEQDFDYFAWVVNRADGYTNTLKEIYNNARMRAMPNQMVTFTGDDGNESCDTCQSLKGKRHRISWFVANDYVPPFGGGLDCAKGGHCQHGLMDDKGNWITI